MLDELVSKLFRRGCRPSLKESQSNNHISLKASLPILPGVVAILL